MQRLIMLHGASNVYLPQYFCVSACVLLAMRAGKLSLSVITHELHVVSYMKTVYNNIRLEKLEN